MCGGGPGGGDGGAKSSVAVPMCHCHLLGRTLLENPRDGDICWRSLHHGKFMILILP